MSKPLNPVVPDVTIRLRSLPADQMSPSRKARASRCVPLRWATTSTNAIRHPRPVLRALRTESFEPLSSVHPSETSMQNQSHPRRGDDPLVDLFRGNPCTVILLCPDGLEASTPLSVIADSLGVRADCIALTNTADYEALGHLETAFQASQGFAAPMTTTMLTGLAFETTDPHQVIVVKGSIACTEDFDAAWSDGYAGGWNVEGDDLASLQKYVLRYQHACTFHHVITTYNYFAPRYSALVEGWDVSDQLLEEIHQCPAALSAPLNRAFIDRLQVEFSSWLYERAWTTKRHQAEGAHAYDR